MLNQIDFEDLVQRCRGKNARSYIKEAVDCYRVGAYRACIISTWIALVYDIIDKLREIAASGDKAALQKVREFDEIQRDVDTEKALKFEREVLDTAHAGFELISAQEKRDLQRLFDDRNRCGHPNLIRDVEEYSPPPELARLHLRSAIEIVLERPPVQGKVALDSIRKVIDSPYFPTKIEDAETALKATALFRAKANVPRAIIMGGISSILREELPSRLRRQRLTGIQVAVRLYPDLAIRVWQDELDGVVLKTEDTLLFRALWLLHHYPDLHEYLKEASWIRLAGYAKNLPVEEFKSVMWALDIPRVSEGAKARVSMSEYSELVELVRKLKGTPHSIITDECIKRYANARSWENANAIADAIIIPIIPYLNKQQSERIISAGASTEVIGSFRFEVVIKELKQAEILTPDEFKSALKNVNLLENFDYLFNPISAELLAQLDG